MIIIIIIIIITLLCSALLTEENKKEKIESQCGGSIDHLSIYYLIQRTHTHTHSLSPSVAGFRLARLGAGSLSGIARPPPSRSHPCCAGCDAVKSHRGFCIPTAHGIRISLPNLGKSERSVTSVLEARSRRFTRAKS
ncbi:hypothetical protein DTO021C3_5639 [Paecilomyces variotii]|nr:hypothetical protein DTO021C3_5639 [Paecilomyces variotii]